MIQRRRLVDYHVHSTHSYDGRSSIIEMCQKAVELGLEEIGFSEHVDFDPSDEGFGFFNSKEYAQDIQKARQLFRGKLHIKKGIEVDYQSIFEEQIKKWLLDKRFDFIIGSVHYVASELINQQLFETRSLADVYRYYFSEITRSIKSGLFDVVGHLDVIRKFVIVQRDELGAFDYDAGIRTILNEIIHHQLYLEINSKPFLLRQNSVNMIPSKEVIAKYINYGGRLISVGSDAHSSQELGIGIQNVFNTLASSVEDNVILLFEIEKNSYK